MRQKNTIYNKMSKIRTLFILVSFISLLLTTTHSTQGYPASNLMNDGNSVIEVTYHRYNNGKKVEESEFILKYSGDIVSLSKPHEDIQYYMDYRNRQNVDILKYEENLYKTLTSFDSLPQPNYGDETETILGYACKTASFSAFSNSIRVWYTEKAKAKGSPYRNYIPTSDALVLKVVINGNRMVKATSIKQHKDQSLAEKSLEEAKEISNPRFKELQIESRYITLNIFNNQQINFNPGLDKPGRGDLTKNRTYRLSKGTVIMKKIALPDTVRSGGRIYAELTAWSNGDAYDRTGSIFVIPSSQRKTTMLNALLEGLDKLPVYTDNHGKKYQGIVNTPNYEPPVEVMRFFTPFGVRHFNKRRVIHNYPWKDAATYEQEITPLIPSEEEEIWIGVFIGNYDRGGHMVSLDLNYYPGFGDIEQAEKWIQPIFNTVNIMEMSGQNYGRLFRNDTLEVTFEVPDNVKNPQLLYTTTGHGGWGGGDEFNPKMNRIFIDGRRVFRLVPWRTDCATYRLYNPASGNFSNGLSSSDLSRSNWCPGTLTPPYFIALNNLEKGKHHTLKVIIDQGEDEEGSFSHWSVSGTLVGERIPNKTEKK